MSEEDAQAGQALPTRLSDRAADTKYRAPRAALQISDFDVIGRIGDGSFSTVILAKLRGSEEQYAIKIVNKHLILRNKMAEYIRNERNILDQLNHDGIVKLLFTFQDPDSLYFGCEFCPGGDLYEQITQKGKLSLDVTRFYTAEIVQILEYIRTKQVVHRDLKPENLLLTGTGHLKLTDFGSARAFFLPPAGGMGKQARATSFVGTAEYVSPEVLNNTPLSYPADLWALGSLIYQMLTGKPPFKAGSEYLTFQKVAEREFEYPEDFPGVARDIVDALIQLDPQDRLGAQDMGALKAHPFFHGINWDTLRQDEAPPHVPPPSPTPELEGLDWEVTSLVRDSMGPMRTTNEGYYRPDVTPAGPLAADPQGRGVAAEGLAGAAAVGAGQTDRLIEGVEGGDAGGQVPLPGVALPPVPPVVPLAPVQARTGSGADGLQGAGVPGSPGTRPLLFGWAGHRAAAGEVVYVRNPEAGSDSESDEDDDDAEEDQEQGTGGVSMERQGPQQSGDQHCPTPIL